MPLIPSKLQPQLVAQATVEAGRPQEGVARGAPGAVAGRDRLDRPPGRRTRPWATLLLAATALVVAAITAAFAVAGLQDKVYGARVDLLYVAGPEVGLDVRERVLSTQAQLLGSRAVLEPVAERERMPLGELQAAVSVEVALSDVLHLTVGDPDPARAQRLAQVVARSYVDVTSSLPRQPRVEILSPAYALDEPLAPQPGRTAALGLLVGLNLAIAAVLLLRRRRRPSP